MLKKLIDWVLKDDNTYVYVKQGNETYSRKVSKNAWDEYMVADDYSISVIKLLPDGKATGPYDLLYTYSWKHKSGPELTF